MSILVSSALMSSAISQISNIEQQLVEANQRLLALHSFASNISDGTISMDDIMNTPGTMFDRTMMFTQNSHMAAYNGAQQKMAYLMRMPGAMPQIADPRAQQMYMQAMFKNLYDQNKQMVVQQEQKKLNVEETKIQQQIAQLEARKKMYEKLLDNNKQSQASSIDRFFSKG